jgi:recombinase
VLRDRTAIRIIQELQAAGCESLRAMAAGLEERGIPAPRGGKWSAVQVARLLEQAAIPFGASDGGVVEPSNTLRLARFAMAAASSDRQAA